MWKLAIQFRVVGMPRPGGSKKGFFNKALGRVMIVDDCKGNKTWRQDVKAAVLALPDRPTALLDGCLMLDVTFYLPRPQGHYGSGRNAAQVKDGAPPFPNVKPDLTKLVRSTEDALTGILWVDDARITDQAPRKRYCEPGQPPGAEISVCVWEREPAEVVTNSAGLGSMNLTLNAAGTKGRSAKIAESCARSWDSRRPARKPWPKGPVTVHDDDDGDNKSFLLLDSRILCEKATKEVANAIVLALNEFPAAVALLREDARCFPADLAHPSPASDSFNARRDALIARMDAAGFDL
jgi:Holliday junction resolvase RusA-like endonuclease